MCAECTACEILKAERVLNTRLRKLIGTLYLKLGECGGINGAAQVTRWLLLVWIFELLSLIHNCCTRVQICIACHSVQLVTRGTALFTIDAVRRYFQKYHLQLTLLLHNHSCGYTHSTGSGTLCQGSLIFCNRSLVVVQHSTGRRTLCQGSLLHSHSSPSSGLQLTGTSTSSIPSLRYRLGQSW